MITSDNPERDLTVLLTQITDRRRQVNVMIALAREADDWRVAAEMH